MTILYVAIGGALGSVLRFLTIHWVGQVAGFNFPYGTLTVNVIGSMLMGVLVGVMARLLPEHAENWRLLVGVGLLGGFTTFSAFSLDVITLIENNALLQAGIYAVVSVILSVAALFAGLLLIRAIPA